MLAHRTTGSGLVIAETVMNEPGIQRALKQIDERLTLQWRPPYHVVVCQVNDHYAPVVATWMDLHGRPLPLSHGLVDKVNMWRLDARNQPEGVDQANERRQREIDRDHQRSLEAIRDDHRPYVERGRMQVTLAQVSRPRYWQRNQHGPRSGMSA